MAAEQLPLPYIPHAVAGEIVSQRRKDGYINATAMCKAAGKMFGHYAENRSTKAFLAELSVDIGIPIAGLVQSVVGGVPELQGTWVHPQVAINLATWASPKFAVLVSKWVYDWMTTKVPPKPALPFHIRRYVANQNSVPHGHFSILTEMTIALIAPLEFAGYHLPEKMWPDISQGLIFARYLREEHGVNTDTMPTYVHTFEDGRQPVNAKAYPVRYLGLFRTHFLEVWWPQHGPRYFRERDPLALPYLAKALPPPPKKGPKAA